MLDTLEPQGFNQISTQRRKDAKTQEKEWERAENVESGKLKCATKVAPGGFQVAVGGHRAITLTCIHSLSTKPGQARVRLKLLFPENAAMITNIITILLNYLNLAFTEQPIWSGVF